VSQHVSRLIGIPGMMLTPLQLLYVHPNPSCDGCARDVEENRMRKKALVEKMKKNKISVI